MKKLFQAFIGGLAIYSILFLIQNLFVLSEVIVEKHAPASLSLLFVSLFFPKILSMTFPFAILFAALFVGAQASANSELVAFTATGISPARQLRPYWYFTGITAILYVLLQFQFVPISKTARDNVFNDITRNSLTNAFSPGEFSQVGENAYLMVRKNSSNGSLQDVILFTKLNDKDTLYSIEIARSASFPTQVNHSNTNIISLLLRDGNAYVFGRNDKQMSRLSYKTKLISLNVEGFVSAPDVSSVRYINRLPWVDFLKRLSAGSTKAWIVLVKRLLLLLFVLLAPTLAFAMSFNLARDEGSSGAFVASFGIAFAFFIVVKLFEGYSLKNPAFVPGLLLVISFIFLFIVYKHYVTLTQLAKAPEKATRYSTVRLNTFYKRMQVHIKRTINTLDHFQHGTLSGYIRLEFLRIFVSVLIALEGIYLLSIALVNLPKYMEINAPMHIIVDYLLTSLPPTLPYVLPFSFAIAAMFHFSWMDSRSELVAIKSLGVSVYRAAAPLLQLALFLSVFMIFVNTYVSPVFLGKARAKRPQAIASQKSYVNSPGEDVNHLIRSYTDPNISYYYEDYQGNSTSALTLEKLVSFKFDPHFNGLQWAYIADKYGFGKDGERIPEKEMSFKFSSSGHSSTDFIETFVPDNSSFFSLHRPEVDEMTSYQLRKYISEQKRIGIQPYRYITSYYDRFASAFSPLILLLVGLPFIFMGKGGRKKSPARGIAAGIVLVVVYYAFASLFHSFGAAHYLPPFLAAWMINILFILSGIFLFTEVRT